MLTTYIEFKRKQMIDTARTHGLSDQLTIRYSQELDRLLDLYELQQRKLKMVTNKRIS
ncbi:aspartyl-phosphate phosphatase Spo0E family protein [Fictibacillus sp. Mic-4]|uniref:aspartyl-phosphate phosphatase Spo0E family protein n=1 Tax=Fictibacillus TaxID=1329200 RepID=UPI000405EC45|nr:aspartyl-phosphate phosphatase Spo0E family protein [Fictibacillus gelatini]